MRNPTHRIETAPRSTFPVFGKWKMDNLRELLGFDNHYKLVATVSWWVGMGFMVWFVAHGAPYTFLLAWGSLSMSLPYGLKGITAWLKRQSASDEVAAIRDESKAIIERRKGGDGYEPTE